MNGPNLGRLGARRPDVYGTTTLPALEDRLRECAARLGVGLECFQSDSEAELIRFVDTWRSADGLVLNPGALMMAGWSLRDCLEDFAGLKYEVHISQVFSRESFRHTSVLADVMDAFIAGLGVAGYEAALSDLARRLDEVAPG
ncbi:type II 3-dehydroquinate dehydratase [Isoptericola sp. G70]|uniref:type II 3-dehydroquinate dehydratase n=1 Tax=Isoptericola sp. G70 TaxID=3376633 RepID=UPI003A7F6759